MLKKKLVQCPICGLKVREDRLEKHKLKHANRIPQQRVAYKGRQNSSKEEAMIRTKVLKELLPGKFLALGFGNVATSNLDGVVVSSFLSPIWVPGSAIEAIARSVGKDYLLAHWPDNVKPGSVHVIDVTAHPGVQFNKVFVVFMNYMEPKYRHPDFPDQDTWLLMGLHNLKALLQQAGVKRVDITALGTQYGGLERKAAFEMLSKWATRLFSQIPEMDLIRITTIDLDTFIDFFEALYKVPAWTLSAPLERDCKGIVACDEFRDDFNSIWSLLEDGRYDLAISVCRTVLEKKVRSIYRFYGRPYPRKLFNAIEELKRKGILPVQIGAYFDIVRTLGNFTVHSDRTFAPTRRDAEIVFYITLRIIEWQPGK